MVWRTVLASIYMDGSGVRSRSLQLWPHCLCPESSSGPAWSHNPCAGWNLHYTHTLPCHFGECIFTHYPIEILLPSYFFLFWLPYANLCFFSHKVSLVFDSSEINTISFLKGLLWPFSSLLVISFNFEKLNLQWFCAAAQLESRYLNCKSSLTECFTFISFTVRNCSLLSTAECSRIILFYILL